MDTFGMELGVATDAVRGLYKTFSVTRSEHTGPHGRYYVYTTTGLPPPSIGWVNERKGPELTSAQIETFPLVEIP